MTEEEEEEEEEDPCCGEMGLFPITGQLTPFSVNIDSFVRLVVGGRFFSSKELVETWSFGRCCDPT